MLPVRKPLPGPLRHREGLAPAAPAMVPDNVSVSAATVIVLVRFSVIAPA